MLKELRPDGGDLLTGLAITMFIRIILEPAEAVLRNMILLMAAQPAPRSATGVPRFMVYGPGETGK